MRRVLAEEVMLPPTKVGGERLLQSQIPNHQIPNHQIHDGVRGVAVSACLAVNQEVRVRLPSDTQAALRGRAALHECAPGRAGSLQNCSTGFDSSRSCSCPDGVADRIRLS